MESMTPSSRVRCGLGGNQRADGECIRAATNEYYARLRLEDFSMPGNGLNGSSVGDCKGHSSSGGGEPALSLIEGPALSAVEGSLVKRSERLSLSPGPSVLIPQPHSLP